MKIASFTFKGKRYTITTSDWFWERVGRYKLIVGGAICLAVVVFFLAR